MRTQREADGPRTGFTELAGDEAIDLAAHPPAARGKAALQEIEALRDQKQAEGKTLEDEIRDLRQRLSEGRLSLAQDKIQELEKELERKAIAAQRFNEDATRELTKKRDEVLAGIEESVFPVINQVGEDNGYTLIFNKFRSGLLFANEAVDITQQVIERYNASAAGSTGG